MRSAARRSWLAGALTWDLPRAFGAAASGQRLTDRLAAFGYGLAYDAVVRGFRPYEMLVDEVVALVERSTGPSRRATRVLDVACGTGTVALRLAAEGFTVVGVDGVAYLVEVARSKGRARLGTHPTFHHLDFAHEPLPGAGTFDVLVSMHTLYWHADPRRLLEACRRALRPGGYAIFLTYARPARVTRLFREIRATHGLGPAVAALRWLLPTAAFEVVRHHDARYMTPAEFHEALRGAGFDILESRRTFLADISLLAWTRVGGSDGGQARR
jgi:SAM-dependent methyltransferase